MGFPAHLIWWVGLCVRRSCFSLLINGRRSEWISAACGFRQGCPLSPYLFIICSELLSLAFRDHGTRLGVQLGRSGPHITHLFYADNILVFAGASQHGARDVAHILELYCKWTGQRVNFGKLAILFSKATLRWKRGRIAWGLGVRKVEELIYLGIKLAARRLVRSDFSDLIKKSIAMISGLGTRKLSLASWIVLINVILLPMSSFQVTHSLVPMGSLLLLKTLARDFLWEGSGRHGLHYVSWKEVCLPSVAGGLGFHAPSVWAGVLRARLAWMFLSEPESLLGRAVRAIYGGDLLVPVVGRVASPSWKIIVHGAKALKDVIRWPVGRNSTVSLWRQSWIGDRKLSRWPMFVSMDLLDDSNVGMLLDENSSWNRDKVLEVFGMPLAERIFQIPVYPE